ncbi:hypothetical protein BS78_05G118300 [Paspalum vaginatum]|nr:hypothetical protein BS78_05G118300 [Paspalum vaginatum]
MTILAAALSSSPKDETCVYVFIAGLWQHSYTGFLRSSAPQHPPDRRSVAVAYWHKGMPTARELGRSDVVDVAYEGGTFYVLHSDGVRIGVYSTMRPFFRPRVDTVLYHREERRFYPGGRIYSQCTRRLYIVESRGTLLLIATGRYGFEPDIHLYGWTWNELDTLNGRMLFLGHGCSRSYDTGEYPGCEDGIYFFDDGEFYDAAMVFGDASGWSFRGSDNGRWSQGVVHSVFPMPGPSDHTPPVWVLP